MSFGPRSTMRLGPTMTPMVKYLMIACAGAFLLQSLGDSRAMIQIFGLTPAAVLSKLFVWQIVTYLFLHGGFGHLFWNMFPLWMFGSELERYWGGKEFLRFFLITGIGAGLLSIAVQPFSPVPTIGASGAVYGVLMAYGLMFPERMVYLYFLFPVKVKYFVAFLGIVTFYSALSSPGGPIAHMAHLGGMVFGFLYMKGLLSLSAVRQNYQRWKLQRMRKKFKVYDSQRRKQKEKKDDFWIN